MESASSGQRSLALVIVDTSQHTLAAQALAHTMRQLQRAALVPAQLLIYSDRADTWGGLEVRPIEPLRSIGAYNRLVLHRLARDLVASHALVIQYDGFVLDGTEFSPHFWHYDYIGAPWPHLPDSPVGNGGFSWRSRRLVQAVAALPYEDERVAEDLFICRLCRPVLEQQGLRFAPPALAAHFSVESVPVPYPTFGFHGVFHLPQVYRAHLPWLLQQLPVATLRKWWPQLRPRLAAIGPEALALFEARLAQEPATATA
jgi:hypothetical protein